MGGVGDVEEMRGVVRGPGQGGLTLEGVVSRFSTSDGAVRALIDGGHLKTMKVINPVNRCPTVIVPAQEVERFEREYARDHRRGLDGRPAVTARARPPHAARRQAPARWRRAAASTSWIWFVVS